MVNQVSNSFNDKWLFEDPLKTDPDFEGKILGPILLAREIKCYSEKYKLLIADNFGEGKLKGASYSLTPDPEGNAWIFSEDGRKYELTIDIEKDEDGQDLQYYLVPENSIVYIRLHQELRLPYYIIGRFNLKVSYTYKGLLLGTGPQVDPGYEGNLIIPLHNLTTTTVKLFIKKSFVTIDFVRTSPLLLGNIIPTSRNDLLNSDSWRNLYNELKPQDFKKLSRTKVEAYVGDSRPTSSLKKLKNDLEEGKRQYNEINKNLREDRANIQEKLREGELKIDKIQDRIKIDFLGIIALGIVIFSILMAIIIPLYVHIDGKIQNAMNLINNNFVVTKTDKIHEDVVELKKNYALIQKEKDSLRNEVETLKENMEKINKNLENKNKSPIKQ